MHVGYDRIDSKAVCGVLRKDFEALCVQLLHTESQRRHSPDARLTPPGKDGVADGGKDIILDVASAPRRARSAQAVDLTPDGIGRHIFSCKSGGGTLKLAMADLKARKGTKKKPAVEAAAIAEFKAGASLTFLCAEELDDERRKKFKTQAVKALASRLSLDPVDVAARIELFDAGEIVLHLRTHRPTVSAHFRQALGLMSAAGAMSLEEWLRQQAEDRRLPDFFEDAPRKAAIAAIRAFTDRTTPTPGGGVFWLYGPPGVGKTRVVRQALLGDDRREARVIACTSPQGGLRLAEAFRESDKFAFADAIILIDECGSEQVQRLSKAFRALVGGEELRLLLVGTASDGPGAIGPIVSLQLSRLAEESSRDLLTREAGAESEATPEEIESILERCEGYPWFLVLLAEALREPAVRRALRDRETITAAVLTPARPGETQEQWVARAGQVARVLIVVTMTEAVPWPLAEPARQALVNALGVPWETIVSHAQEAHLRGLIRLFDRKWSHKYVTPLVVLRLAAEMLLERPFGVGPAIRKHAPEFADVLSQRLLKAGVPAELLEQLLPDDADGPAAPLEEVQRALTPTQSWLTWAQIRPGKVARQLRLSIEATTLDRLREIDLERRDVVFALEHATKRRDGFEDAERGLFRLGLAENESYGNNATGVWTGLFLFALGMCHRSPEERWRILERRLSSPDAEERAFALKGLQAAASKEEHAFSGYSDSDKVDGDWPEAKGGELLATKRSAWEAVARATDDPVPAVAARAREILIREIGGAVFWHLGDALAPMFADRVPKWPDEDRTRLREALGWFWKYSSEFLEENDSVSRSLATLRDLVAPRTLHQALLAEVGSHRPDGDRVEGESWAEFNLRSVRPLAARALEEFETFAAELDWLESRAAPRALDFARALGEADSSGRVLPLLRERATVGKGVGLLTAYLQGRRAAGAETEVAAVLRAMQDDPRLASHALDAIWRSGATAESAAWVFAALERGWVVPEALAILAFGGWAKQLPLADLVAFVLQLLTREEPVLRVLALHLAFDRAHDDEDSWHLILGPMEILVTSLASVRLRSDDEYVWDEAVGLLLEKGRVDRVLTALSSRIRGSQHAGDSRRAWGLLKSASFRTPEAAWKTVAGLFDASPRERFRILMEGGGERILDRIPAEIVTEWVGKDETRARYVAQLCTAHEAPLNEHARRLLMRFGHRGAVAHVLTTRVGSTLEVVVGGFGGFYEEQIVNARRWAEDPEPEVAAWARSQLPALERERAAEQTREEFDKRNE